MKSTLGKIALVVILAIVVILALHPELTQESEILQLGLGQLWESVQAVSQILWKMGESVVEIFKFLWNKYIPDQS